ncbi:MAG: hypothetical protein AB1458_02200 [Bacteroidota bacterium]
MFATRIITAIATVAMLSACGGEKPHNIDDDREVTTDTVDATVALDIGIMRAKMPMASELGKKLAAAGVNYNKALLNPSSKASSYSTKYQQALGMGAYGMDLGYAAAFNQKADVTEYLGAMGNLSKGLGIDVIFNPEFVERMIKAVGSSDSLDIMIDKAYDRAERNMQSNARVQLAVLMIAGGWIEGIYVTAEQINSKKDDPKVAPLYHDIYDHCSSLQYINEMLDAYKGNPDLEKFRAELAPYTAVIKSVGDNPNFGAGPAFDNLYKAIKELRGKLY